MGCLTFLISVFQKLSTFSFSTSVLCTSISVYLELYLFINSIDVHSSMSLYSVSFQSLSPVLVGWTFTTVVMRRARGREVATETY